MTVPRMFMAGLTCLAMAAGSGGATAQLRRGAILLPPVRTTCISSPFGPRVLPNLPLAGAYHYGVDLPAPLGASVLAPAPGVVLRIQNKVPGGLEMLVQHNGFVGIYSHFGKINPALAEGKAIVAAGEPLGIVGNTGVTSGAHLYFEMVLAGKPIDPAPYLGLPQCNGEVHRALTDTPDIDGKTLGARKYYQIFFPERQYHQWQQR